MIDVTDGGPRKHMPTYQYRCTACGEELEVFQKFTDESLTTCPACEGALRKVFSAVGVVFKGSGFYSTDSRKTSSSTAPASSGKSENGGTSDSSAPSSKPSEPSKPAAPAKKAETSA